MRSLLLGFVLILSQGVVQIPLDKQTFERLKPEVTCQVLDWNLVHKPLPALTLVCPAFSIRSPIRVFFRLTWKEGTKWPLGIAPKLGMPCKVKVQNINGVGGWEIELHDWEKDKKRWVLFDVIDGFGMWRHN